MTKTLKRKNNNSSPPKFTQKLIHKLNIENHLVLQRKKSYTRSYKNQSKNIQKSTSSIISKTDNLSVGPLPDRKAKTNHKLQN